MSHFPTFLRLFHRLGQGWNAGAAPCLRTVGLALWRGVLYPVLGWLWVGVFGAVLWGVLTLLFTLPLLPQMLRHLRATPAPEMPERALGLANDIIHTIPSDAYPFLALPAVFMLFVWTRARGHARIQRGREVMARLHDVLALGLPLPQGLAAAAEGERGILRRRLFDLSYACAKGRPLAEAVANCVPEIGQRQLGLLRTADRSGRLGPVVARLAQREEVGEAPGPGLAYAVLLGMAVLVVCLGLHVLVAPKFVEIFKSFGTSTAGTGMPLLMVRFAWVSEWLTGRKSPDDSVVLGVLALAVMAAMFAMPGLFCRFAAQGRDLAEPAHWGTYCVWRLPLVGKLLRYRAYADACLLLAESLRAGHDLPQALADLEQAQVPMPARRRFCRLRLRLLTGEPLASAAAAVGLPPALAGLLALPTRDLSAQLDEAERLHRAQADHAAFTLRQFAGPAAVVACGAIVGLVGWALVSSMAQIIAAVGGFDVPHSGGLL